MRVKAINRVEEEHTRERNDDLRKVHRNPNSEIHPLENAKEYVRALNAAKLDRVFAKPFIASFAHNDAVQCLARNPSVLNSLLSGSSDGEVRLWDVPAKRCLRRLVGHKSQVTGIAASPQGNLAVSSSTDCTVRLWHVPYSPFVSGQVIAEDQCVSEYSGKFAFRGIDFHPQEGRFVTAGHALELWDVQRSEPVAQYQWGSDTVISARINPVEGNLVVGTGSDRGVVLYDTRANTAVRKTVMQTRCNAASWNPLEGMAFVVANEDCCLYTFDMRNLARAACVHKDFTSAVMDVDFSPTGREFVAGSYDRTLRVFTYNAGHSREVYYTTRMQRVFAVRFSGDASYVFSGSDDMNVRMWKAKASEQLGIRKFREQRSQAQQQALLSRYSHLPEIKRITRHRHLPALLYKQKMLRRIQEDAASRKLTNKIAHSKPGTVSIVGVRKKKIVTEEA